jgi:hypothetical protein
MVTSRKPRPKSGRPRRETLAQKFERILAEPLGTPFPKMTKREARYFLKRLSGSDPDAPSGEEVMREFYGDWSEDEDTEMDR